jgi:hypothetical protein
MKKNIWRHRFVFTAFIHSEISRYVRDVIFTAMSIIFMYSDDDGGDDNNNNNNNNNNNA